MKVFEVSMERIEAAVLVLVWLILAFSVSTVVLLVTSGVRTDNRIAEIAARLSRLEQGQEVRR